MRDWLRFFSGLLIVGAVALVSFAAIFILYRYVATQEMLAQASLLEAQTGLVQMTNQGEMIDLLKQLVSDLRAERAISIELQERLFDRFRSTILLLLLLQYGTMIVGFATVAFVSYRKRYLPRQPQWKIVPERAFDPEPRTR